MGETKQLDREMILERIRDMQKELELLKRDLIRGLAPQEPQGRSSLYGSVKGGDITEEMVDEAKRALFRPLEDI